MRYVIAYASLMSDVNIKRLFPNVGKIKPVIIHNHARCFNSFGTRSIALKLADSNSNKLAHASAILRPNAKMMAIAFELDDKEFEIYRQYEFRYDLQEIEVAELDSTKKFNAVICYENTDQNIDPNLVGFDSVFDLYEHYQINGFWHAPYLPATVYMDHCLASANAIGQDFFNNFLDNRFLYDRSTSLRA